MSYLIGAKSHKPISLTSARNLVIQLNATPVSQPSKRKVMHLYKLIAHCCLTVACMPTQHGSYHCASLAARLGAVQHDSDNGARCSSALCACLLLSALSSNFSARCIRWRALFQWQLYCMQVWGPTCRQAGHLLANVSNQL